MEATDLPNLPARAFPKVLSLDILSSLPAALNTAVLQSSFGCGTEPFNVASIL